MPITIDDLIARMEWVARQQLAEYACRMDGHRITIRRPAGTPDACGPVSASVARPEVPATDAEPAMTAPLAGLCHLLPEAGGAPFVRVGDRIKAGQTVCVIEAMKMMTAIPADASGTVEAILVVDGETVAAGAPLIRVRA